MLGKSSCTIAQNVSYVLVSVIVCMFECVHACMHVCPLVVSEGVVK